MATQRLVSGPKSDDPEAGEALTEVSTSSTASSEPEVLTKKQCEALVDNKHKERVFRLLCLSAMVDTAGSSLLSPAYAMAVSNAPGSVPPAGGVHPDDNVSTTGGTNSSFRLTFVPRSIFVSAAYRFSSL